MGVSILVAIAFLLFLAIPLWSWLQLPDANFDGWLLAAYAIVFTTLASYRSWLERRQQRATARCAGAGLGIPAPSGAVSVLEQLALMSVPIGLLLALNYAPAERTMGDVQRIFYVHVPSAWVAFLAFTVVFVFSVDYLARRRVQADQRALAAAEVGVIFTSLVLISGPIWARPVWGIWWTWDARLTLTLVLWLVYVGYLMLRSTVRSVDRQATLGAVVGILGFVGVPINYMAIRWWRTQHPAPVMGGGEGSGLHPQMLRAFLFNLAVFTIVFLALFLRRVYVARLEESLEVGESG